MRSAMAKEKRSTLASVLRTRITGALRSGALKPGTKLPSVRDLAPELGADPRVIAVAYRTLARDGLVEIRPRSGIYVAESPGGGHAPDGPSPIWLADILTEGVRRGVPAQSMPQWISAAISTRRVRVVVLATILDQADGLARELRDDYGLDATGMMFISIERGERLPRAVTRAHLLMSLAPNEARIKRIAARVGVPAVIASVRPDLMSLEWRSLMREPVYVIVADPQFARIVREFVQDADTKGNVRVLVAGRDSLADIREDAPVYVTESARERLGRTRLPARIITQGRTLTDEAAAEVMRFVVELNLSAYRSPTRRGRSSPVR